MQVCEQLNRYICAGTVLLIRALSYLDIPCSSICLSIATYTCTRTCSHTFRTYTYEQIVHCTYGWKALHDVTNLHADALLYMHKKNMDNPACNNPTCMRMYRWTGRTCVFMVKEWIICTHTHTVAVHWHLSNRPGNTPTPSWSCVQYVSAQSANRKWHDRKPGKALRRIKNLTLEHKQTSGVHHVRWYLSHLQTLEALNPNPYKSLPS